MFIAYQSASSDLLFPALKHLHFNGKLTPEDLICFTALAPPSLEGLHLEAVSSSRPALLAALQHAADSTPRLVALTLRANIHLKNLWSSLRQLTALKTVHLAVPYAPDHVEYFCSLPTLQDGSLSLSPAPSSSGDQEAPHEVSNLQCNVYKGKKIHLAGDFRSIVSAIPVSARHGVREIKFLTSYDTPKESWDLEELLEVISISCSNVSNIWLQDFWRAYTIPLRSLWKLMALDNLQSLVFRSVRVDCGVEPTQDQGADQLFHHLCLSAKHKATPLTTLRINAVVGEHLSFASLHHVCAHLPHLVDLEIPIDSSLSYEVPDGLFLRGTVPLPHSKGRHHPMKELRLVELRQDPFKPKEYRSIALFLNHLFPDLDRFESSTTDFGLVDDNLSLGEGWKVIDDMRSDYQCLERARLATVRFENRRT
jgi:hypothetical protein